MPMRFEAEAEQDCRTAAEKGKEQGVLMLIDKNCQTLSSQTSLSPPISLIQGVAVNIRTEISYKLCDRKCKMYYEGKKTY